MNTDTVWTDLRTEAHDAAVREPMLSSFLHECILDQASLDGALACLISRKLQSDVLGASVLRDLFEETLDRHPAIGPQVGKDLSAVNERDPASCGLLSPFLHFKGFHALSGHRVAHALWHQDRPEIALHLQSAVSRVCGVDIHPAARIGAGILLDHATSIVIGETATVEDRVSILHEVTLGGTGKVRGRRHPQVRQGVLIGAGAKLLGYIEIGEGAKIGAGSVVLEDVPPHTTVVGVPARVVGRAPEDPAGTMQHALEDNARDADQA